MVTYLSTLHWELDALSGVHRDVVLETVSLKGNYYFKQPRPFKPTLWDLLISDVFEVKRTRIIKLSHQHYVLYLYTHRLDKKAAASRVA